MWLRSEFHLEQALEPGPVIVADEPVMEDPQRLMGPEPRELLGVLKRHTQHLHALGGDGRRGVGLP